MKYAPIGIFDSGYGGLTIFKEIRELLPDYDFLYLGDNARAPYGDRSFEIICDFTLQAVKHLFSNDCPLIILACNTASAKALRTIQQKYLPTLNLPNKRILGIIRPTTESIGEITRTRHIGILGTTGTITSQSYTLEINKFFPDIVVNSLACPIWAPLVEAQEINSPGTDYFIKERIETILSNDPKIDTLVLACTHYPLLKKTIEAFLPPHISLFIQGPQIAKSLKNYLQKHIEIDSQLSHNSQTIFQTTESPERFCKNASFFLNENVSAQQISLL